MKTIWIKILALTAGAVMYSHAVFGIGAQWAPAPNLEVAPQNMVVAVSPTDANRTFALDQKGVSGLQGFGIKLWLDFFPFIDLDASSNFQYGYYDLDVLVDGVRTPVQAKVSMPFVASKPVFTRFVSDASILYPFFKLPPAATMLKLYVGGGLTHTIATEIVTGGLATKALQKAEASGAFDPAVDGGDKAAPLIVHEFYSQAFKRGMGFHLMTGAKMKFPVIPVALYANAKYHILMTMPALADANSVTFELGAALAL